MLIPLLLMLGGGAVACAGVRAAQQPGCDSLMASQGLCSDPVAPLPVRTDVPASGPSVPVVGLSGGSGRAPSGGDCPVCPPCEEGWYRPRYVKPPLFPKGVSEDQIRRLIPDRLIEPWHRGDTAESVKQRLARSLAKRVAEGLRIPMDERARAEEILYEKVFALLINQLGGTPRDFKYSRFVFTDKDVTFLIGPGLVYGSSDDGLAYYFGQTSARVLSWWDHERKWGKRINY